MVSPGSVGDPLSSVLSFIPNGAEAPRLRRVVLGGSHVSLPSAVDAVEEERRRIARELHDVVGQAIVAARFAVVSAQNAVREGAAAADPDGPAPHLDWAVEMLDEAMTTVRACALALRPAVLDDLGLAAGLRWLVARARHPRSLDIRLALPADLGAIDPEVETACFRIVQEALSNIRRHANARRADVSVAVRRDRLEIEVEDDGKGFVTREVEAYVRSGRSLGLVGMHERAAAAHGMLEVWSEPGAGTRVHARLPISGTDVQAGASGEPDALAARRPARLRLRARPGGRSGPISLAR